VTRIKQEKRQIDRGEKPSFSTPNKTRPDRNSKTALDDFDRGALTPTILNFHVTERKIPTLKNIHKKFCEDIRYQDTMETLLKEIHKLGLRWRKFKNNRKILMENHDIRHARVKFLRKIRSFREEGRPIVYMDENYINSSHTHQKGLGDNSNEGLFKPISKGLRLIIINAGGENGFVPGAYARWKLNSNTDDYHHEMNFENYEKWVRTQLVPHLLPKSVVAIDNAPYHNKQKEKCPTSASRKDDTKKLLRERGIPFNENMLKSELYNIVKNYKPRFQQFKTDDVFIEHGFDVLRLAPYHPDLNPIELVWASMKQHVAKNNVIFNFSDVIKL
jgi:transposase